MTTQTTDIRNEIRRADDAFEKNFNESNAAGVAELYTNDAMLLPPGSDFVKSKETIRDFWQGAMNLGIKEARLDIVDVDLQGDVVIETGKYQLKSAANEMMDHGKYIVIWKQEEGQWKLHRDIWNTSRTA